MPKNSVSPLILEKGNENGEVNTSALAPIEETPVNLNVNENPLKVFSAPSENSIRDTIGIPDSIVRVESIESNEIVDEDPREMVAVSPVIEESAEELLQGISMPPLQSVPDDANVNTKVKKHPQATLEALRPVISLKIRQTNRDKEDFANVPNHYEVVSSEKTLIFNGHEETEAELRVRVTTSTNRSQPFTVIVHDVDTGDPVLRIQRNGFNDSPTQVLKQVTRMRQEEVGVIFPDVGWNIVRPSFSVVDEDGNLMFRIVGPDPPLHICHSSQNPKANFEVLGGSNGEDLIARICKDGDLFVTKKKKNKKVLVLKDDVTLTVQFERKDLELTKKVMIMAACFMLDYTYFSAPSLFVKICNRAFRMCG